MAEQRWHVLRIYPLGRAEAMEFFYRAEAAAQRAFRTVLGCCTEADDALAALDDTEAVPAPRVGKSDEEQAGFIITDDCGYSYGSDRRHVHSAYVVDTEREMRTRGEVRILSARVTESINQQVEAAKGKTAALHQPANGALDRRPAQ